MSIPSLSTCFTDYPITNYQSTPGLPLTNTGSNDPRLEQINNEFNNTKNSVNTIDYKNCIISLRNFKTNSPSDLIDSLIDDKISVLKNLKLICKLQNFGDHFSAGLEGNIIKKDKPAKVIPVDQILSKIENTLLFYGTRQQCEIGLNFIKNNTLSFPWKLQYVVRRCIYKVEDKAKRIALDDIEQKYRLTKQSVQATDYSLTIKLFKELAAYYQFSEHESKMTQSRISVLEDLRYVCYLNNCEANFSEEDEILVIKDFNKLQPNDYIAVDQFLNNIKNIITTHGTNQHREIGINFLTILLESSPVNLRNKFTNTINQIKIIGNVNQAATKIFRQHLQNFNNPSI